MAHPAHPLLSSWRPLRGFALRCAHSPLRAAAASCRGSSAHTWSNGRFPFRQAETCLAGTNDSGPTLGIHVLGGPTLVARRFTWATR